MSGYSDLTIETEIICLVCQTPPGDNPLGLCNSHFFQFVTMRAAGREKEFLQELDKQNLIGRVRHRQQYRYNPITYGFGQP